MSTRKFIGLAVAFIFTAACGTSAPPDAAPRKAGFSTAAAGPQLIKLRADLAVTMHSAVSSLPVPTGGNAGGALSAWDQGQGRLVDVVLEITGNGGTTLTGPVGLYGGSTADGQEYLLGKLNSGNDIVLSGSTTGYAETLHYTGVFDYLAIGGVSGTITPSAGKTVTVRAIPIAY